MHPPQTRVPILAAFFSSLGGEEFDFFKCGLQYVEIGFVDNQRHTTCGADLFEVVLLQFGRLVGACLTLDGYEPPVNTGHNVRYPA